MLYIFLEDPGTMVRFDMTLALESVATLKKAIEEQCHIPAAEQILLISGGERLEDNQRVGKYHTGTDNNPIFLFRDITNGVPPVSSVDVSHHLLDISQDVNSVLDLDPSINTVISRSQLAQKLCVNAQEQLRACEALIHEQHLQQQGWAAVLAHLDDMIEYYTNVCNCCEKSYNQFLDIKDNFVLLLNSFNEDLNRISKIPVLPGLLEQDASTSTSGEENELQNQSLTLLDWISSHKDGNNDQTLTEVAAFCSRSIQILDMKLMYKVNELREFIRIAETNYRDVRVIETKLEHLEELMRSNRRIVQDQVSQAQTFISNKTNAMRERDGSILEALCTFHREWLLVMESNHNELCENLRQCAKYKTDLCTYLQTRLQWVRKMFSDMRDTNEYVFLYYESIKKLRAHYEFLQSLRSTPQMYVTAVSEVVRRRAYSQAFLAWANEFSCQLLAIHSEEVARRKRFQDQFEGHFLDKLFPGLDEYPPAYATQAPEVFDAMLPKLSYEDLESLRQYLLDVDLSLSVPDLSTFSHLLFLKSVNDTLAMNQPMIQAHGSVEDRIVQVVNAAGLASNLDSTLLKAADYLPNALTDRGGFESEEDTEEFEKLRHSGQTVSECSESNETIQTNVRQLLEDTNTVVLDLKTQLVGVKQDFTNDKNVIMKEFTTAIHECRKVLKERERTIIHLIQILGMKESELCTLRSQVINMESNLKSSIEREANERLKLEELQRQYEEDKQREIKEITENMRISHKAEMDNLRSRYKLMASNNMERSPSDTSLEKIETNHEAIIAHIRENFELEKEKLLTEERKRLSEKMEHDLEQYKIKVEAEKQLWYSQSLRGVLTDHNNQIEEFRKRETKLLEEIQKYEESIRMTSHSGEDLVHKIERLESEKAHLEHELRHTINSHNLSTSSVSIYDHPMGMESSSPHSHVESSSPNTHSSLNHRPHDEIPSNSVITEGLKLSTSTCRPGDIVLILWNDLEEHFHIFTSRNVLHLLHPDYIPPKRSGVFLKKYGFIAEVVRSEYCSIKKVVNRYRLPVNSKFYRVEVGPISRRNLMQASSESQS